MNEKKAKRIRRELREDGIDPRETRYISKVFPKLVTFIDEQFVEYKKIWEFRTFHLSEGCGRSDYKIAKGAAI